MMTLQQSVNQTLSLAGILAKGAASGIEKQQRAEASETKARQALQREQERKRKTRRNFLQYMKDEPTNLGVSFGQLPTTTQKELAKEYTKSQRKAIMDRKDAMKKK